MKEQIKLAKCQWCFRELGFCPSFEELEMDPIYCSMSCLNKDREYDNEVEQRLAIEIND